MNQIKAIDGLILRDMVVAGAAQLEKNRELVDALNVFPVPDGDTGTNMSLTMQSAVHEINSKEFLRVDEAAAALSKGALRGARGNSGVITSQLLRGFAKAINGNETITPAQFAAALQAGANQAYKAVMKPKEGTILTVARVIAEKAVEQAAKAPDDFDALMMVMMTSGEEILKRTPDMLLPLKQAGVVDSGGQGLLFIYAGYASVIRGEEVSFGDVRKDEPKLPGSPEENKMASRFDYAVSYSIINLHEDCGSEDVDSLRRRLNRTGDNVSVVNEGDRITVEACIDHPGNAIEFALELGEVSDVVVENLALQRREKEQPQEPPKPYGMIAVSLGEGFSQIFRDLGVSEIVEGGQTMNPSTEDILGAITRVNAEKIFIFPNNGNVVLAAQQAAELSDRNVCVIPTKNVAMGIAAAVAFNPELSIEDNAVKMNEAAQRVRTASVTYAIRDSEFNGVQIKSGDIMGLHNGQIEVSGLSLSETVLTTMNNVVTEDDELITVYYGADVSKEDAEAVTAEVADTFPDCDVECHFGGQPLYYYLISVE